MTDTLVLHDVLIDGADGRYSQIDLLMIGCKGIYVVEVKMYPKARIYGDGKNSKWYYYLGGKRYEIYSPLKQKQEIYQYILDHQHSGKEKRKEHVESIKEMKQSQEEMKEQNICPYCKTPLILRKGK